MTSIDIKTAKLADANMAYPMMRETNAIELVLTRDEDIIILKKT